MKAGGIAAAAVAVPVAVVVSIPMLGLLTTEALSQHSRSNVGAANVPSQYAAMVDAAGSRCNDITAPTIAAQIDQESGWNPNAVSPVGAQGLTQFMPDTWAIYGKDANHNGVTSPFDPADAIDAQGRFMCELATSMRQATAAGTVRGELLDLVLASYNAGPAAVIKYGGIPPYAETQGYVQRIRSLIVKYTATSSTRPGGGGPVPAEFDQQGNPRTVEQAIAYLSAHVPNGIPGERIEGRCERHMNLAYGLGGGYPTALSHWNAPGPRSVGSAVPPPRGALVFFDTNNEAEHVALSLGPGPDGVTVVISTDYNGRTGRFQYGVLGQGPITDLDRWGNGRLGWRAPNFRVNSEAA